MLEMLLRRLRGFERDESGAFLLMSLAAILIIMMTAFIMYDTGNVTRQKVQNQVAADTAAYSASAVKARSMNQIVYANIAKRTIVGLTAGYETSWRTLKWVGIVSCAAVVPLFVAFQWSLAEWALEMCIISVSLFAGEFSDASAFHSNLNKGYKQDLKALDNIQEYFYKMSPWWAWSESIIRASRNGASMSTTYPVPELEPGTMINGVKGTVDKVLSLVKVRNAPGADDPYYLPIVKLNDNDKFRKKGLQEFGEYGLEATANAVIHFVQSDVPSGSNNQGFILKLLLSFAMLPDFLENVLDGNGLGMIAKVLNYAKKVVLFPTYQDGFNRVMSSYGKYGHPFFLDTEVDDASWQKKTSTLELTYRADKRISTVDKQRYNILSRTRSTGLLPDKFYDVEGQFAMAKSEIFYNKEGALDLWHAAWSARMRPIALADWGSVSMRNVMVGVLPYLMLSPLLTSKAGLADSFSIQDGFVLYQSLRGIESSTANGLMK